MIMLVAYLVMLIISLPSCLYVGPQYKKPEVTVPAAYKNFVPASTSELKEWWTLFDDPCLNALIQKAVNANYKLRIAVEKIEQTRAEYKIQRAKLFPQIYAYGTAQDNHYSSNYALYSNLTSKTVGNFQLLPLAIWELDFWGKLRRQKNAAFAQFEAQIESMRDVYVMLLADVAQLYLEMRGLEKKIASTKQRLAADQKLAALIHDALNAGIKNERDYQQQLAMIEDSKTVLLIFEKMIEQNKNSLAALLSENPQDFELMHSDLAIPSAEKIAAIGLPSTLLQRRPDIRKAERDLAVAVENVGLAYSEYFPTFFLFGDGGPQSSKIEKLFNGGSLGWSVAASFIGPIVTFGRITYTVQAKKSIQKQAFMTYAQTVVDALKEVENALVGFLKESDRLSAARSKHAATERTLTLVRDAVDAGIESETAYLTELKNYCDVCVQRADAEQSASTALVMVYKSVGGGW